MTLKEQTAVPNKPTKNYQCQCCSEQFQSVGAPTSCPKCGARGDENLIPIYAEFDEDRAAMQSKEDWHAGD